MYKNVVNLVTRSLAFAGAAIILGDASKIMLGPEFFVSNDLTKSVLEPSFNQVLIQAVIVAIMTVTL
jgi:uncharacterized membrane protein